MVIRYMLLVYLLPLLLVGNIYQPIGTCQTQKNTMPLPEFTTIIEPALFLYR